jgi:hypothetical protein
MGLLSQVPQAQTGTIKTLSFEMNAEANLFSLADKAIQGRFYCKVE